jgi:hypothetical protein
MYRSIFLLLFMICLFTHNTHAQEIRVQGNMLILGYIDDPFVGGGIGFEAGVGEHFSLNADANWGSHERGTSLELRSSVNYYFGMEQKGLFVGAAFKYISLSEKNDAVDDWEDNLYSIGFNLGLKAVMSENWSFAFTASPHKTVGGRTEGDVAGISAQLALGYRF